MAAASELLWRDAIAARLLVLLDFDGFDACAGVPAGETMPDLLGVSAGCGLDGCSKPGLLMTLLLTHNPARGWDLLADPMPIGDTACTHASDMDVCGWDLLADPMPVGDTACTHANNMNVDTGQGQLRVWGGLPPWPDPLRGPPLGSRMYGCWNHALILSGDATRTWAFAAGASQQPAAARGGGGG